VTTVPSAWSNKTLTDEVKEATLTQQASGSVFGIAIVCSTSVGGLSMYHNSQATSAAALCVLPAWVSSIELYVGAVPERLPLPPMAMPTTKSFTLAAQVYRISIGLSLPLYSVLLL